MKRYYGISANLDEAFRWLESGVWENLPVGKQEIDGNRVYALVQSYDSKAPADCRFETHKAYIDIQMLVSGKEIMQTRSVEGMEVSVPYVADIEFHHTPKSLTAQDVRMEPGLAVILFPEDAHRPGMAIDDKSEPVRKIVVKVAIR
jgi:YhcH/YjgK/YiaL family protein